ncbi:DNA gyrase subunit A [Victivallaceae bacterium BBE-744-WT-12]|uniref:DNA gyrase subunit A n=1 Tax=Victivallis lenta TaxID=2606640 RepID=A0A844G485_9BACT|nr:DNA gyrase subunit A [Victivallis lenta]AVM44975.1 DNA gyrase subunit A [Victivallales bacterium CCUG 44730]MBS1452035.1 DNA gyrase subunit A [Lentisphaeria bacterium]MBS5529317.1 DNA gyrase subunit A [bacterium]MST97774.1 DNA gyrase subunit A [Victivallis lenta]HBP07495.1 DNA gyrase subunit A [Lentisphaeria bacterium]
MSDFETRDIPVNIEDIMHTAYLQYSLSVNVGRAIPDVRDGLKPVNRRILYAMKMLNLGKSHATVKCARVVGEVMGKYHPHGDSAIYDALVRLAQDFSMRAPLIEGQGNFGNIDGDPAAASRYTECRMERLAEEMLFDIEKDTVNMIPNFDESEKEPEVLPASFPQLLVNGTTGIGVGMATSIPPHNLGEVIDATVCLLDNPKATVDELMEYLPGPDFPTGAIIRGRYSMRQFYQTGRGSVKLRAKADIIEKDGVEQIIITEIPYAINKGQLVEKIAELVKDKRITGISSITDVSSKRVGLRIEIGVKRGAMGSVILNQLYSQTQLETVIGCTMLVVDHNRPRTMNLAQVLQAYIDHRLEVVLRRAIFDLNKAEARSHILEGLLKALANIDEVVQIIRESRNRQEAQTNLIARFAFTQIQADAILDMRLHQLTGLAVEVVQAEFDELQVKIDYLRKLVASRDMRLGVIREELIEIKNKYSDPRRSEITVDDSDLNIADLIPRHSCVITVSNTGYIKRVPSDTYRTQHRGGKGIIGMETKEEDYVEHLFNADSHDLIFFFTDRGFMYWLNVYEIPEGSRTGKGKAIVNMIKVEPGEKICAMLTVSPDEFDDPNKYIVMASRRGYIKKSELALFKNLRRVGLRALVIEEDDDLIGAGISENGNEILLSTRLGMACLFDQDDEQIRPMGRTARGVTGMRFKIDGDSVVSMEVIREHVYTEAEMTGEEGETETEVEVEVETDEEGPVFGSGPEVLVVTDGGMGKRSFVSTYRKTNRGAKGVVNIKLREGEHVLAVVQVTDDDEILLTTERGQLVRIPASEIRTVGRASKGVRIMNLNNGDRITGVAKLVKVEIEKTAVTVDGEIENKADNVLAEAAAMPEEPAVPGEDVPEQPGESEE